MKLRKLLSAIVAAVLVIGLFPSIGIEKAYATSDTDNWIDTAGNIMSSNEQNWFYSELDSGGIHLYNYNGEFINGEIVGKVPAFIYGKPVVSMANAFKDDTELIIAPEIPDSVTDMGSTFYNCTSLTQAPSIPNSVENMDNTFYGCTSLTQAPSIGKSVINMNMTFYNCTSLKQATTIPDSVTNMDYTFYDCTSLTQAPSIGNSVTTMNYTFSGCESLKQAPALPNSVTNINNTFENCKDLINGPEIIPSSVIDMGGAFKNCINLETIGNIPDSVTSAGWAFAGCQKLYGKVNIPDNLKSQTTIFYGCTASITGKAIDKVGNPIPGVKIILYDNYKNNFEALTDKQGNYLFTGLDQNGKCDITANYEEVDSRISKTVRLNYYKNGTQDFTFNLDLNNPSYTITCIVNNRKGEVVTNGLLLKLVKDSNEILSQSSYNYSKSGYVLGSKIGGVALYNGTYNIEVYDISINEKIGEVEATIENNDITVYVNVEIKEKHTLNGTVYYDEDIAQYADLSLTNKDTKKIITGRTSRLGDYHLYNLVAGNYEIEARKNGYSIKKEFSILDQDIDLDLHIKTEKFQKVSGTITDSDTSSPLSNVQVKVKDSSNNQVSSTTTNSDGTYEITDLPAGNYILEVVYQEVNKAQSFTITTQDEVVDMALNLSQTEITDPDVPLVPGPVDGKVDGNMPIYGTVNPINMIDVTLPISMTFVIDSNRIFHAPENIEITSRCPAPLNTSILSINKSENAPGLVAPDTYTDEQWNNLTKAKTYKEIALTMNGYDLSSPGNSLGILKSAFNAANPSTPNTQQLALELDSKYGKAWNNSEDYTFTYNVVFEFEMT